MVSPVYLALYAEIHYTFFHFPSLLKKRQPEIVADAPFRIEPSAQLPVLCLIKDANRYPLQVEQVVVEVNYQSGRSQVVSFPIGETIESLIWHKVCSIEPLESGTAAVEVTFWIRDEKGRRIVRNDNYYRTSHTPLVVQIASAPLPRSQGWYYGEAHFHSNYTSDQAEFGAPVSAAVELAQAMGLNWLAVTDHSYDLDNYPGEMIKNSPSLPRWEQLKVEVARLNRNTEEFVTLVGEEISCGNNRHKNIHLLGYGIERFIPGSGDSAERLFQVSPELSVEEAISRVREQGGVAYAAHPCAATPLAQRFILQRHRWGNADLEQPGLNGLQFWNGAKDTGFYLGKHRWKQLLLAGKRLFALGGNDAHGDFNRSRRIRIPFLQIGETSTNCFGKVRTCLLVEGKLNEKSVLDALSNGRSFLTDGPFVAFQVQNEKNKTAEIGGSIEGKKFSLRIEAKTNQEWGEWEKIEIFQGIITKRAEQKVKVLKNPRSGIINIENLKPEGPAYFRLEAQTKKGRYCLTNPIWVQPTT